MAWLFYDTVLSEREEEAEGHERRAERIRRGHDSEADLESANAPAL